MLDAAVETSSFVGGRERRDLDRDRLLVLALQKAVEIIGEAATGGSKEARAAHPEIPWDQIIAMRHRIVHGYDSVDLERLWDTVTVDVPVLVPLLEHAVTNRKGGAP